MLSSRLLYGFMLSIPVFAFAGCGDIELPESLPTPTPEAIASLNPLDSLQNTSPTPVVQNSCQALQEERDNLSEAVTLTQEELRSCEAEKAQLESLSVQSQGTTDQMAQLSPILSRYISDVPQEEYVFDACGGLGTVSSQDWFSDFETALTASAVPFEALGRTLEPTDFYSVCTSEEGQTALFLGASSSGESEFHMMKYDFDERRLSSAVLIGGDCSLCPNSFGKRFGPYITLNAVSGGNRREYFYYYDSNIIEPR